MPGSRRQRRVGARSRSSREVRAEVRAGRLATLQEVMADVLGDAGWLETIPADLESWISVDDDLTDRAWLDAAKTQLVDASVLPEHAGAPPPRVRAWNASFIATYLMNVDSGMGREDAIDSARQNAHDEIILERDEHHMTRTDPDLYPTRRWRRR